MTARRMLTRRELYDLVWSKPMREVAIDLGLSDVGLAKVCDRHRVPRPPQGYWNKLQAGKPVKKTTFAETADQRLDRIEIVSGLLRLPEPVREIVAKAKAQRKILSGQKPASVAQPADPVLAPKVHEAIRETARALRKNRPDTDGAVQAIGDGLCGISVGTACVERVVSFLDALAHRLETKGLPIVPAGTGMKCGIGSDSATFTVTERTRRQKHVPTTEELAAEERRDKQRQRRWSSPNPWDRTSIDFYERSYPEFDFIRSGELVLQIEGYDLGIRKTWSDGKIQRLELLVDDMVAGIEVLLAVRKVDREKREDDARRWEERARRRELAEQRGKREEKRIKFLDRVMDREGEIARLGMWLAHLDGELQETQPSDFARMVTWARGRLASLETAAHPSPIGDVLREKRLFPAIDDLHDPEGELLDESDEW